MRDLYDKSWAFLFDELFKQPSMQRLSTFLADERATAKVFPAESLVYNAFKLTPFRDVKVVILGQDPFHNDGQAHGLSFSVPEGISLPPSLRNIYTELETDIPGFVRPAAGDLSYWAEQGVLLLNAMLTVRAHEAGSHQQKGWEQFTDQVIAALSKESTGIVFILWGSYAQKKSALIDAKKHLILKAVHPSPLSAYRGFFGCKHFSMTNAYLEAQGKAPIDWQI